MEQQDFVTKPFLVALSFPGEHRTFARRVAARLAEKLGGRERVFLDEWHRERYLGLAADLRLARIYREDSALLVPFFSEYYEKPWCQVEWHAIRSVIFERRRANAVLPIHLDGTRIEGWGSIDLGIRRGRKNAAQIADEIFRLLEQRFLKAPEATPAADPRQRAIAAHGEKLLQRYLVQVRDETGRLVVPVAHSGNSDGPRPASELAPIGDLIVDLPLSVVVDPLAQHDSRRQVGVGHTVRISQTPTPAAQAARFACRIGDRLRPGTRPTVLIGQPGCGKSTLFKWIAHSLAGRLLGAEKNAPAAGPRPSLPHLPLGEELMPIVVICRELQGAFGSASSMDLEGLLDHQLTRAVYTDDERHLLVTRMLATLNQGRGLLLIDGLDEIHPQTRRREFAELISSGVQRTGCRAIITCRVIGYEAVRDELRGFEPVMVDAIPPDIAETYVRLWADAAGLPNVDEMLVQLKRPDVIALTENALMLALITQMIAAEEEVPKRKVDVLHRLCEVMLASRGGSDPGRQNEVFPHLEWLAYAMRTGGPDGAGVQRLTEREVISVFQAAREAEPDEACLAGRLPADLLSDILDRTGLLNVVGWQEDERGYNRRIIQFFHQLVQEYFAGLAVVHGRTPQGLRGAAQIVAMLAEPVPGSPDGRRVFSHFLGKVGHGNWVEPVIAERWQEVIPLAIASLRSAGEADAAMAAILSSGDAPADEARARAVLALRCLAESPRVSDPGAANVVAAALAQVRSPDGHENTLHTQMDLALSAVARSSMFEFVRDRLLDTLVTAEGDRRHALCLVFHTLIEQGVENTSMLSAAGGFLAANVAELLDGLEAAAEAKDERRAVEASARLLVLFYTLQTVPETRALDAADAVARERLLQLASRPDLHCVVRSLVLWALGWLLGTRYPDLYAARPLTTAEAERLSQLLVGEQDDLVLGWTAELIAGAAPGRLARNFDRDRNDWIYECAVVADGGRPQSELREAFATLHRALLPLGPRRAGERQVVERLERALGRAQSKVARQLIARALCRFDVVVPAMIEPLDSILTDDLKGDAKREEALLFLLLSPAPEAARSIARAADSKLAIDEFLQNRGLFGNLLAGDVDLLAEMAGRGDAGNQDQSREYAYALAGIGSPAAEAALEELARHDDDTVRQAVQAAREKVALWRAEPKPPLVFAPAPEESESA